MVVENIILSNDKKTKSQSSLISHNITINGRRTSVRLEKEMWLALQEIADIERCRVHDICTEVANSKKEHGTLSAAIRGFAIGYYRRAATDAGHEDAGHGKGPNIVTHVIEQAKKSPYFGLRTIEYLKRNQR